MLWIKMWSKKAKLSVTLEWWLISKKSFFIVNAIISSYYFIFFFFYYFYSASLQIQFLWSGCESDVILIRKHVLKEIIFHRFQWWMLWQLCMTMNMRDHWRLPVTRNRSSLIKVHNVPGLGLMLAVLPRFPVQIQKAAQSHSEQDIWVCFQCCNY